MNLFKILKDFIAQANKSLLVFLFILVAIPMFNENFLIYIALIVFVISITNYDPSLASWENIEWSEKIEKSILLAILLFSLGIRLYGLGYQSFWMDEAITANAALGFLEHGIPQLESGFLYLRSIPQTLFSAISVAVLGKSEMAFRLPSVIFGVLSIFITYLLAKEMFNGKIGLLSAALMAISYWHIAWSRQARMYPLLQMLYTWAILLAYKMRKKPVKILPYLIVVTTLAIMTHRSAYAIIPAATAYLAILGLDKKFLKRRETVWVSVLYVIVAVVFGVVYTQRGQPQLLIYLKWFQASIGAVFAMAVAGAGISLSWDRFQEGTLLLFFFAIPIIYLSSQVELFASRYIYFTAPIVFIWASVGFWRVADIISNNAARIFDVPDRKEVIAIGLLLLMMAASLFGGLYTVDLQREYELGINAPQPNFRKAHNYVEEHRSQNSTLICGWMPPCVYYGGKPDYWLTFDLTGTNNYPIREGREFYSGAKPLRNFTDLARTFNKKEEGWVVLDKLAFQRQSKTIRATLETFKKHHDKNSDMRIYSWNREE